MRPSAENEKEIQRIIDSLKCGRDPPCHACGFAAVGHVKSIGGGVIECLEQRGRSCSHGLSFGNSLLCQCPLRQYLAEHDLD